MDTSMNSYTGGKGMNLTDIVQEEIPFRPPAYEIARAIEWYRKNIKFPIPDLLKTIFNYYEAETGKTDGDGDGLNDTYTEVTLCDYEGNKLKTFVFSTYNRMQVK